LVKENNLREKIKKVQEKDKKNSKSGRGTKEGRNENAKR